MSFLPPPLNADVGISFTAQFPAPIPHCLSLPGDSLLKLTPSLSWGLPSAALPYPVCSHGERENRKQNKWKIQPKLLCKEREEGINTGWNQSWVELSISSSSQSPQGSHLPCFLSEAENEAQTLNYQKRHKCSLLKGMDSRSEKIPLYVPALPLYLMSLSSPYLRVRKLFSAFKVPYDDKI